MRNLKLTVEYDGTEFHGFQRQPRLRTVQRELETRFERVLREPVKIVGAGRTDAGVHAEGQVVNFVTARAIPVERMPEVLNAALPGDVKIQTCEVVPADFHARRHARSRTYRYRVIERELPSPLMGRYAYVVPGGLDVESMGKAAEKLVGRHDFRAFQGGGAETKSTERTIKRLRCRRVGKVITLTVEADGFLYHMVRIMMSALLRIGRGELRESELMQALAKGDRRELPGPAPACGLCLVKVSY